jgi:hypothetical protein
MPKPPFTVAEFLEKAKKHGDYWQLDTVENMELEIFGKIPCKPEHVWVCQACGKTSRTKYGFLDNGERSFEDGTPVSDPGWDESCMLHAVLCEYPKKGDTWVAIT